MGSISKVDDGKWRARWRTPENASRSKTFERKTDAETWLTNVEHNKLSGAYIDPQAGKTTFEAHATGWLSDAVHLRSSTRERLEANLQNHLLPAFGDRAMGSITPTMVRSFITAKSTELAPGTVGVLHRQLTTILRAAVADRKIATNPAAGMKLPREARTQVHPMPVEQIHALADAVPRRYRAAILLGAGCGLRQGETFGLTLDRVDFLKRTVRVDRQLVSDRTGASRLAPAKTDASHRTVPAPDIVLEALAEHVRTIGTGRDGLLFTLPTGNPVNRSAASAMFRRAALSAGVADSESYHSLRHVYASLLIVSGCSVKVVSARLGHASAAMTLDTYAHLWPDDEERTRVAIDGALRTSGVSAVSQEGHSGT